MGLFCLHFDVSDGPTKLHMVQQENTEYMHLYVIVFFLHNIIRIICSDSATLQEYIIDIINSAKLMFLVCQQN